MDCQIMPLEARSPETLIPAPPRTYFIALSMSVTPLCLSSAMHGKGLLLPSFLEEIQR